MTAFDYEVLVEEVIPLPGKKIRGKRRRQDDVLRGRCIDPRVLGVSGRERWRSKSRSYTCRANGMGGPAGYTHVHPASVDVNSGQAGTNRKETFEQAIVRLQVVDRTFDVSKSGSRRCRDTYEGETRARL